MINKVGSHPGNDPGGFALALFLSFFFPARLEHHFRLRGGREWIEKRNTSEIAVIS